MNIEPHNLIDPLREKFPHLIRHEKLYRMIHRQLMKKWFQYFVLFFIIGSICSIIYSSFEESAPYRNSLYAFNYLASFIFTIEYGLRIAAAPVQYASCNHAWKARLRYLFSFYGIIDFVAIIPFMVIYVYKETPHVHLVVLAYVLIIFKLIRYSRSFQMIGTVLRTVREEPCYGLYCLWHHVRLFRYSDVLHRTLRTTGSLRKYRRRFLVGNRSLHHRGLR